MNYKVHKNILDDELYGIIYDLFNGNQFPWYYQASTLGESDIYEDNEFMFAHKFYHRAEICSSYFVTMLPLTLAVSNIVKSNRLLRIKANMYTNQGENIYHGVHTDYPNIEKYTTAVYNLTTCDGGTVLYINDEEIVIPSEKNTLLVFDGVIEHAGFTQTDTKNRTLINYDFI